MNKFLSLFFVAFTSSLFLFSCKSTKPAASDADVLPHALLWKIEGPGQAQPSYLFGTIHMIPKEDYFFPDGLDEAFEKSDHVVFEIDLDEMSDMGSLMGMLSNIMMKNGTSLEDLLTDKEYAEVSAYFEKMGLPMFILGNVKPMFLSMLAEINMSPDDMQSDDMISYEMELYDRAQKESKDVGGLETMQYQMSLFDSISYKDQAKMLLDAVRGNDADTDMYDQTVDLYKHQDIGAMIEMVDESGSADNPEFEKVLINNRNESWIPRMAKLMHTGPVFFAVGAGHLAGQNGVLNLLKKAGYKVSPVSTYNTSQAKKV